MFELRKERIALEARVPVDRRFLLLLVKLVMMLTAPPTYVSG